jgi:spermidine synthase
MLGPTVYAFSVILAVFLIGLGIGSTVGSMLARRVKRPRAALGWCQLLLAAAMAWTAHVASESLPYWPIYPFYETNTPWIGFQLDLVRCLWAILPATCLWGASFPLALAAVAGPGKDPGRLVGGVYAANTVGAILGALFASLLLVRWLGSQDTQRVLIGLAALSGLLLLAIHFWPFRRAGSAGDEQRLVLRLAALALVAATVGAIAGATFEGLRLVRLPGSQDTSGSQDTLWVLMGLAALSGPLLLAIYSWPFPRAGSTGESRGRALRLAGVALIGVSAGLVAELVWKVPAVNGQLIAYGREVPEYLKYKWKLLYVGEGMNSSVAVTERPPHIKGEPGYKSFHVAGKVEASNDPEDMRLQRLLGHLPALVHPEPKSVLVVGCGAGVTAGSFMVHPSIKRVVICELEPLVPKLASKYFAKENHHVVTDPRVEIVYDDARHYILTTNEKFDIITSDPIHPWVKGSATLYTKEYFELVKQHLNPGGVVTQWVPLYESTPPVVKSEVATFFEVFPHGTVWENPQRRTGSDDPDGFLGYDTVLLGQVEETKIDIEEVQKRLDRPDHSGVVHSLMEVNLWSGLDQLGPVGLFSKYAGQASDLKGWTADAEINYDRNLRLQYLAGIGYNTQRGHEIATQMWYFCEYPENLFVGSSIRVNVIRAKIKSRKQTVLNSAAGP